MLEHFAEELRLARAASGMSQTALAEALSYSGALVAKVETSERRPSLDFARRCDAVFGADGRFERIQRRISREAVVPWFRDWAGIEQETTALRCVRAALRAGPGADRGLRPRHPGRCRALRGGRGRAAGDRPARPAGRAHPGPAAAAQRGRRRVRAAPPRRRAGGDARAVAAPREARLGPAPGPNPGRAAVGRCVRWARWSLRDRHRSTGEDVVYLDGQRHGQVIDRAEYVRQMVEVWESIRGEALSQQQSLDLIAEVAETWS